MGDVQGMVVSGELERWLRDSWEGNTLETEGLLPPGERLCCLLLPEKEEEERLIQLLPNLLPK